LAGLAKLIEIIFQVTNNAEKTARMRTVIDAIARSGDHLDETIAATDDWFRSITSAQRQKIEAYLAAEELAQRPVGNTTADSKRLDFKPADRERKA
jgi:hypothetical protein